MPVCIFIASFFCWCLFCIRRAADKNVRFLIRIGYAVYTEVILTCIYVIYGVGKTPGLYYNWNVSKQEYIYITANLAAQVGSKFKGRDVHSRVEICSMCDGARHSTRTLVRRFGQAIVRRIEWRIRLHCLYH
jgi:hypothetical protein